MYNKNIQGFEKSKIRLETNSKLIKALDKMGQGLKEITTISVTMQKSLPELGNAAIELRIKESGDSQKPLIN